MFYLLFGVGIAIAVALRQDDHDATGRWFQVATAFFFWPLYVPILLERPSRSDATDAGRVRTSGQHADEYAVAIARVESELETALDSLDGWAENVLAREQDRFAELKSAWRWQANRIRELDRLLAAAERQPPPDEAHLSLDFVGSPRFRQSEQARKDNLERLRSVRQQLRDDLLGTLAWVRELVSMIHLAKFTGAPASRAEELVAQIATAVEGLSEVTKWHDDPVAVGH
jgi:hypothetical protein